MIGFARNLDGLQELAPPQEPQEPQEDATTQARQLASMELNFRPYVFSGPDFPPLACDNRDLAALLGPHTIQTIFYDRNYNVVTSADEPGRYGAVIEIVPQNGRATRRFRTLFRQAEPFTFSWWSSRPPASITLPPQLGVSREAAQSQAETLGNYVRAGFTRSLSHEPDGGALLSGLHETASEAGPANSSNDVWARDRQWWVGLKRKLDGLGDAEPFICPRALEGAAAPVLREGSEAQAGMKPGTVQELDELLQEWARDSDQGFALCLARRGVIFLHRAYGTRHGQPMTTETPSWMASITKLLGGSLLMMLVDQGRVSLDEPVTKYLHALRGIEVSVPLTLRHLMTHTGGLWGHLGDEMHDFEHIVADLYPQLQIGRRYEYNGAGMALAGKVIEAVSGEALPQFFARHLLGPLKMEHTGVTTMSWDTQSIPLDIARAGQMLLNRGAYGSQRFFSPATFEQMLPRRLEATLGPDTTEEYGIGTSWFRDEGLGEGTFGHGAASSSTLRIDPANELVVVMARNEAGSNFNTYHPRFLNTIGQGVATNTARAQ